MGQTLRVCIFDEVAPEDGPLLRAFDAVDDLRVVESFDKWKQLRECLRRNEADLVAVNLDGADAISVVEKIAKTAPEIGVIGVSGASDASFIIKAMRAGCGQFVCAPIDPEDLRNAIQRARPTRASPTHPARRVCLIGSSGGAGTTTIACNLALELAQLTGRKVVLADLNLEYGDVACSFDCVPKYSIADICSEGAELDHDSLEAVLHELPCNVAIIARPERIEQAREVSPDGVEQLFRLLGEAYPHVIVDLPRAFSFLSSVAVGRSSHVLIVTQLGVPFIRNAERIYDSLMQIGVDPDIVQIVLNRCNAEFERITVKDVEEHFRRPVFAVIPNDYQFVSASLDLGHPIGADSPASKCRSAIQDMARRIAPECTDFTVTEKPGEGFLGKLLGRRPKTPK